LILARRFASFSKFVAMRSSAWSRKPPVSPARIIATISRGKMRSCRPIDADSDMPPSTSWRMSRIAFFRGSFSVCSSSTASERSRVSPDEVIVANCRAKIERSLSVTRLRSVGRFRSLLRPLPASMIDSGVTPCARSVAAAAASFEASMLPLRRLPEPSRTS
jgi:hypothetical protein